VHAVGNRAVNGGYIPECRRFAKTGCPASLRPAVWRTILGLDAASGEAERRYFGRLRENVECVELLTDELFQMDVSQIADNDYFFPFAEVLANVVYAFSRDPWVLQHSTIRTHKPLLGHACAGQPEGSATPPCGVQPFRGFVNYVAPLCFLFETEDCACHTRSWWPRSSRFRDGVSPPSWASLNSQTHSTYRPGTNLRGSAGDVRAILVPRQRDVDGS